MRCPSQRRRRKCLVVLGFLLLPPLAWSLVLAVLPTGWARDRLVARLTEVSGRPVTLGGIRVGFLGGVRLTGLTVAAPRFAADPWLRAASARINVSLAQLLFGHVDPTDLSIDGLTLRVLRRADGSYELAEADPVQAATGPAAAPATERPWPTDLAFRFTDARVSIVDEPTGTRLELTGVRGRGSCEGKRSTLHELHGTLNDGSFELAARLDRTGGGPAFEGEVHASKVALNEGMGLLGYLSPALAGGAAGVEGRLALDLYLKGRGTSRADLRHSLVGRGAVALDPVQLDGSLLVAELADALNVPPKGRVGSAHSDFTIGRGRVTTENLTIDLGRVPVLLSGWTDFDGRLDYRLTTDRLANRLPAQALEFLGEMRVDLKDRTVIQVTGTLDRLAVRLDGALLSDGPRDGSKLHDLGRRFKERILR